MKNSYVYTKLEGKTKKVSSPVRNTTINKNVATGTRLHAENHQKGSRK